MEEVRKLKAIPKKMAKLLAQLERQLLFEEEFGVAPHNIKSITLIPKGRGGDGFITHHSRVVLKSGETINFPFNVKAVLSGVEYKLQ